MSAEAKLQHCENCGEELGRFKHSRRLDGPLVCGKPECARAARDEERLDLEERQARAEEDGYGRY